MPPKRAAAAAADDAISTRPKRTKTSAAATPNDGSTTKTKPTAASKAAKATMAAANTAKKREPVNQAKTTAKSTAASKSKEKATATASKKTTKRKASEESEDKPVAKKTKAAPKAAAKAKPAPKPKAPPKAPKVVKLPPKKTIINKVPTQCLEVFVFGEGSAGELGLGTLRSQMDIKRPRLNPNLSADKIGIVEIDAGGMHVAALTHDNRIFTWGVNDQGALGRDTTWDGGLKDMDDATDSDDENSQADTGMNPHEANPAAIPEDAFPAGTTFVKVATSDSATWALTDDGHVWGWGTFRGNEGIFGFNRTDNGRNINRIQSTPMLLPQLKNIVDICCGSNHVLALDKKGDVYAWGVGQQMQLGRRIVERNAAAALDPTKLAVKKIKSIAAGSFHNFAIDEDNNVWTWGLNSYGETGIPEGAGGDGAVIIKPTKVPNLSGIGMKELSGGSHHSAGVTDKGECFVWGRMDGGQVGIAQSALPVDNEDIVKKDEAGRPRILLRPTQVPNINAVYVACGPEHTIAISDKGKAYSWGFNANYQLGLGHDDDVMEATMIENKATKDKKLNWAGAGGQYSVLTAPADAVMKDAGEGSSTAPNGS